MTELLELPKGVAGRLVLPAADYARDRKVWLRGRRHSIGASEISCILGLNRFTSPLQIWEAKTTDEIPDDRDMPEAAFWGLKNEHNVATVFSMRHPELGKIAPTPGVIAHKEKDFIRVTLDRLLVKRRVSPVEAVAAVECKTIGDMTYKNHWADGLPPAHIQLQVQFQMGVTELPIAYVPHLIGGNYLPEPYIAEREDDLVDSLFNFTADWWERHIVRGERPAPTLQDADRMSDIWPARPPAKTLRATAELLSLIGKHLDAKRREKEAETEKKALAFQIQAQMMDSEEIMDPENRVVTRWKRPKQSYIVDADRLEKEQPEIFAQYQKPKSNPRTFTTLEIDT